MTRKTIEVTKDDHKWLMETRGPESIKKRVSKVIAKYKEVENAPAPKSPTPH